MSSPPSRSLPSLLSLLPHLLSKCSSSPKPNLLTARFHLLPHRDPYENLQETHDLIQTTLSLSPTKPELELCRRLAESIGTRAARLSACGVAAIVKKKKINACHVGADGSVFEKYPYFKARGAQALREILDWDEKGLKDDPVVLYNSEDGSGLGAAVVAALTVKRVREGRKEGVRNLEGLLVDGLRIH